MEVMWSEVAQVERDEKGRSSRWDNEWSTGGERWSGEQLSVGQSDHLSTWDRALYAHAHIRAMKRDLILPFFWARCVSLADTLHLHKTTVSSLTRSTIFNDRAC
jgi:hypothetical protein